MDHLEQYKWTIVCNDHKNEFIHSEHISKSNPEAQLILADISNNHFAAWRNYDCISREWFKNHFQEIKYSNIAVVEWDVLITEKLPNIYIDGFIGKRKKTLPKHKNTWPWFKEKSKLCEFEKYAVGMAPLAVYFINRSSLETILDSKFDYIFNQDIFGELRLPSVLNSQNINICEYPMPFVFSYPISFKIESGIYHPIKNKYIT